MYWDNLKVAVIQNGTVYYLHNDHLGTPQVATNQNQAVVWMADYEPFGKVSIDPASSINIFSRFPGQYQDDETGLYYNYFRDYDPAIGRYIQSDPIGLADGPNTYGYVGQNPLSYIDPLGLNRCYVQPDTGTRVCHVNPGQKVRANWSFQGASSAFSKDYNSQASQARGNCITCVAVCMVLGKVEGDLLKAVTDCQAKRAAAAGIKIAGKRAVSLISGVGGALLTAECTISCFE